MVCTDRRLKRLLAKYLLDPVLFPSMDAAWIIRQYERIQTLNRERKDALAEHRHTIIYALTLWAERQFYRDILTCRFQIIGKMNTR